MKISTLTLSLLLLSGMAYGLSNNPTAEELEAWFNSPDPDVPAVDNVNEGELHFLARAPEKPVHHHQNESWLTADSLSSGFARLRQCHDQLDAVNRLQITFAPGRVEDLKVEETRHIGKAWVEGHTVQVRDIGHQARLCLTARTRSIKDTGAGFFTVSNGPFMRRFLDGFYPMRVSMILNYPVELVEVVSVLPAEQTGFTVSNEPGRLQYDALFEGELRTSVQLRATQLGQR